MWEPVHIMPGVTVTTWIPLRTSSARSPWDQPTNANLLATYGSRWGKATFPPIDAMFTIDPSPRASICGKTASVVWSDPKKLIFIAMRKLSSVWLSTGPTRITRVVDHYIDTAEVGHSRGYQVLDISR